MESRLILQFSACAVLASAAVGICFGAEAGGQPIEFSKPRTELVTTNLQETTSKKLEETLLRQRILSDGPRRVEVLDSDAGFAIGRPLPPPVVSSPSQRKRLKEYIDRRRNWVYLSAEELGMGWETEEKLGLSRLDPVSGQKEKGSVIERFYQRLKQQSEAQTGQVLPDLIGENGLIGFVEQPATKSPLARKVEETEQTLQNLFQSQPAGDLLPMQDQKSSPSILPDLPWTSTAYTQSDADRKSRLDEFKRLLEPPQAVSAAAVQTPGVGSFGNNTKVNTGLTSPTMRFTPTTPPTSVGSGTVNPYSAMPVRTPDSSSFNQPLNSLPPAREPLRIPQPPAGPPQRKF